MKNIVHIIILVLLINLCSVSLFGYIRADASIFCESLFFHESWNIVDAATFSESYAEIKTPTEALSQYNPNPGGVTVYTEDYQTEIQTWAMFEDRFYTSIYSYNADLNNTYSTNAMHQFSYSITPETSSEPFLSLPIELSLYVSALVGIVDLTQNAGVNLSSTLTFEVSSHNNFHDRLEISLCQGAFTSNFHTEFTETYSYENLVPNEPLWLTVSLESQVAQIPEPVTLFILALGGLALRKNKN